MDDAVEDEHSIESHHIPRRSAERIGLRAGFPANREINREACSFAAFGFAQRPNWPVITVGSKQIPCSAEQRMIVSDQGILPRISVVWQNRKHRRTRFSVSMHYTLRHSGRQDGPIADVFV
jgi:hypothetical protein